MTTPAEPAVTTSTEPSSVEKAVDAVQVESDIKPKEVVNTEAARDANPTDSKDVANGESASDDKPTDSTPDAASVHVEDWGTLAAGHPLLSFHSRLPDLLTKAGHNKIWGVQLSAVSPPEFSTLLILQKFLRSVRALPEEDRVDAAAKALEKTLAWRKEFGLDGVDPERNEKREYGSDFDGLGYVTSANVGGRQTVVSWNIYGGVKDIKGAFGDLDRFLHWRISIMERAMSHLSLATTREPIPDIGAGDDPHQQLQVHDYGGVSFFRLDPAVKAASKATISLMAEHYPESLARKFFVGVPRLAEWVFAAVKLFVSTETARKFVLVSDSVGLKELMEVSGADVSSKYGGTGKELPELEKMLEEGSGAVATDA